MSPFMGTVKSALIEDSARAGHTEPKSRHVVPCIFLEGVRHTGPGMAQCSSVHPPPPIALLPQVIRQVREVRYLVLQVAVLYSVVVPLVDTAAGNSSLANSAKKGPPLPSERDDLSSPVQVVEPSCVASLQEYLQLPMRCPNLGLVHSLESTGHYPSSSHLEEAAKLLCSVRAPTFYVECSGQFHQSEQLFCPRRSEGEWRPSGHGPAESLLETSVQQLAGLRLLGFITWTSLPFRHGFCMPSHLLPLLVIRAIFAECSGRVSWVLLIPGLLWPY
ncbi:Deoxyribose-phosphate aldolase [Labeo rohita]|uniref:Deoxyribose-phosphate aldolase n=1 Tax=Labeo rohita TaxID=84645 RepID=A0ABQ8MMH4_LABRO|nr:Deoxyribose-phosphate aldolase [Labeo rohita]